MIPDLYSFHFTVYFENGEIFDVSEDAADNSYDSEQSAFSNVSSQYPDSEDIVYEGVEKNY